MFRRIIVLGVVLLGLLVAACGVDTNAEVGGRDTGTANVINMPRGWSNIAYKCDGHGHMVFASDHGDSFSSSVAVIADDECQQKGQ